MSKKHLIVLLSFLNYLVASPVLAGPSKGKSGNDASLRVETPSEQKLATVSINNQGQLTEMDGQVIDSFYSMIFVVKKQGELIVLTDNVTEEIAKARGIESHMLEFDSTSFSGGESAKIAGEIRIREGQIKEISNWSSSFNHQGPSEPFLVQQFLTQFQDLNVNLNSTVVQLNSGLVLPSVSGGVPLQVELPAKELLQMKLNNRSTVITVLDSMISHRTHDEKPALILQKVAVGGDLSNEEVHILEAGLRSKNEGLIEMMKTLDRAADENWSSTSLIARFKKLASRFMRPMLCGETLGVLPQQLE